MAFIRGIGMVSACGPSLGDLHAALLSGTAPSVPGGRIVDMKKTGGADLKKLRRADKLSKLSVLAARAALLDASLPPGGIEAGVILCTALGPHPTTFRFLDDIIEYGDGAVSPTTFSNSVHNAAASYIAEDCGLTGPTLTVTQMLHSFEEGLALALAWLREARVPRVLLGAVDVHGDVLGYVADRMLQGKTMDSLLKPFVMDPVNNARYVPGEGAVFFLLDGAPEGAYCGVGVEAGFSIGLPALPEGAILIPCADGLIKDETHYLKHMPDDAAVASYAPHLGSMMTGSAFQAAAGALMLREQRVFPSPSAGGENPHGLRLADEGLLRDGSGLLRRVDVLRLDCAGRRGLVTLTAL